MDDEDDLGEARIAGPFHCPCMKLRWEAHWHGQGNRKKGGQPAQLAQTGSKPAQ